MESEVIQSAAETGGTAIWTIIAGILWRVLSVLQKMQQTSADGLNHTRSTAQRAERHYDNEEELYRSLQEQYAIASATKEHTSRTERSLIRINARLDSIDRRHDDDRRRSPRLRGVDPNDEDTG